MFHLSVTPSFGQTRDVTLSPTTALDIAVDARSIGLGESLAGMPGDMSALTYNPAGLSGITGVRAGYSYRSFRWFADNQNRRYLSGSFAFSTPACTFGLLYNRAQMGVAQVTALSTAPAGYSDIGSIEMYSNMLAIGVAREITDGLSCGVALKGFDEQYRGAGGDPGLFYESQGCFLVDVGLQYRLPGLLTTDAGANDAFTAGAALQNFGTDLREQMSVAHQTPPPSVIVRVPRYVRIGFAYAIRVESGETGALTPLDIVFTGSYRNLLNPGAAQNGTRDTWGWGLESTLYEIIAVRLGGLLDGAGSIYGAKGTLAFRYGGGVRLPLEHLGAHLPLTVGFECAAIPVRNPGYVTLARTILPAFSLNVRYDESAF